MKMENRLVDGHWCYMPTERINWSKVELKLIHRDEDFRNIVYELYKISTMGNEKDRIQWKYKHLETPINKTDTGQTLMAVVAMYDDTPIAFTSLQGANNAYGCKGLITYVHPAFRRNGLSMRCYRLLWHEAEKRFGVTKYPEQQIGHNIDQFKKLGFKQLTKGRMRKDGRLTQVVFLIGSYRIKQ